MRSLRRFAVLAMLCGAAVPVVAAGAADAAAPVRIAATFDRDAALGSATALEIALQLDPRRLTKAPLTELQFAYPRNLGLVTSGLGLAACTRPATDFAKVLISATGLGGCSPNAVMGIGTALALVRLSNGQVIPEYASVTLLSGRLEHGRLGLAVYIDGQHPFGAKLAFAGDVRGAHAPYGGQITMRMPAVPGLEELATVALVEMRITIGSHAIRYYERRGDRTTAYHPEGIQLPVSCPARGFRFKVRIGFADGSRRFARSTTPCPPSVAVPFSGR
jgi:hypothetical protein